MKKEGHVHIRISPEDKELLEKDAKETQRTISNLLLWCWKKWRKNKKE